jgi:hypothetical protein
VKNQLLSVRQLFVLPILALLISPGKANPQSLALPLAGTTNSTSPALSITNSGNSYAILGNSPSAAGVVGGSNSSFGVFGLSQTSVGVAGSIPAGSKGAAVAGYAGSNAGYAGYFSGNVTVTGTLQKGAGSFKIDDPLDPGNKYLSHSFVESPDMMNIYNGIVALDAKGEAWVQMPKWFGALNRDFRYQLTGIGASSSVYISQEMVGNRFKIGGGKPGMKVSWQVTGIRHDVYANAHRIPVEENKPVAERGHYLHPELYGQSPLKSVAWAEHPKIMERMQQLANQKPARQEQLAATIDNKDARLKQQAIEITKLRDESNKMRVELDELKKHFSALSAPKPTLASEPVASKSSN